METVKVSPKYQVVIPRKVREQLGIRPGQRVQVFLYGDRIEFVPLMRARWRKLPARWVGVRVRYTPPAR